jgi:hypothetical protein
MPNDQLFPASGTSSASQLKGTENRNRSRAPSGLIANCSMPATVSLNGMQRPVRRSRSRFLSVMTVDHQHQDFNPDVLGPL